MKKCQVPDDDETDIGNTSGEASSDSQPVVAVSLLHRLGPAHQITVGYSSTASAELPAWLAKETGIFAKNGLDVQLVYFRGGTTATMALLSRQTPISQGSGQVIVNAALRGADTVMVAGGLVDTEWWLMTRPDIKTAEQLKARLRCHQSFWRVGRIYDPHRAKKARPYSGERYRIGTGWRAARAPVRLGDRQGSGRHAPDTL